VTGILDTRMMARAIQLAHDGRYRTRPNPAVGCVLAHGGEIIGEGSTRAAGLNHAEIEALEDAARNGRDPRDATAYVTLEPCSHQGKTGPCTAALHEAGIVRVVVAMQDPNPAVGGEGILALTRAGIDVEVGLLEAEAEATNPGFFMRMRDSRPYVRVKLAASLDGRTSMASGESQWITGPEARADVQRLRGLSGAIVTGIETVIADDPALTVRDDSLDIPGQPLRVVLDSRLRTPPDANIFRQPGDTLVACCELGPGAEKLEAAGAELAVLPATAGVDLAGLLSLLAAREVNDILVECGPRLAGAFIAAGFADELVVYTAPTLLGSSARPLLDLPIDNMADQKRLAVKDLRRVGEDVRWILARE
jgi:diaminohydroxyphosphoribosylaminopyrimidine deaminase/5-amino-6-(5-phosphoribosylamino)uracil reductase